MDILTTVRGHVDCVVLANIDVFIVIHPITREGLMLTMDNITVMEANAKNCWLVGKYLRYAANKWTHIWAKDCINFYVTNDKHPQ